MEVSQLSVNVGTAVGYLDLDISGFSAGLKSANSEATKEINNLSISMSKGFEAAGSKLTSAGKTLTKGITVPLTAAAVTAIKTGIEFESAFAGVRKTIDATEKEFEELSAGIKEMSKAMPQSASDIAAVAEAAGQLGIRTENVLDFTETMIMLGDSTNMSSEEAATALARLANITQMPQTEFDKLGSVIVALGNNLATTEREITDMGLNLAAAGSQVGMTEAQVLGFASALSSVGIEAAAGGTAFSKVMVDMQLATELGGEKLNKFASIAGMSADQFKVKFKQDAAGALTDFIKGLQTTEEKGMSAIAVLDDMGIVEVRMRDALLRAAGAGDLFTDSIDLATNAWSENVALQAEAEQRYQTTESQLIMLKNKFSLIGTTLADTLIPMLMKLADSLGKVADWFMSLNPETQESIVKWGVFAAAIGPVLLGLGKLSTGIGSLIKTTKSIGGAVSGIKSGFSALSTAAAGSGTTLGAAFTAAAAPIAAVTAAVALAAGAFATLWKNNEEFRDKMTGIWEEIKGKFEGFIQGIVDRVNELGFDFESIVEIVKTIWNGFCEFFAPAFESGFQALSNILDVVFDVLLGLLDIFVGLFTGDWEQAWEGVKGIFVGLWDFLEDTLTNTLDYLFKSSNTFLGLFGTSWEELWDNVSTFFEETWQGISDFFENTWNGITEFFTKKIPEFIAQAKEAGSGFLDKIVEFFTDLPYKIGFFIGESLAKVVKWAQEMEDKAKETAKNFLESIVKFFKELPGKVADHLTTSYNKAKEWSNNMRDKAIETGKNFLESIVSFFKELPGKLWNYFNESNDKAKQWVLDMGNRGLEAIRSLINNVVDGAREIPQKMADIGRSIVTGVWDGISGAAKWLTDQVSGFFSGIVGGVQSVLGVGSPSKVFAEKVGKWLPAGIAVGFKSALPDAMKSMQTDLDKSTISLNTDFYAGVKRMGYSDNSLTFGQANALMQSGQSASHSKNDIKIDINVNANVANDYDVRSLANELGVSVERELRSRGVAAI